MVLAWNGLCSGGAKCQFSYLGTDCTLLIRPLATAGKKSPSLLTTFCTPLLPAWTQGVLWDFIGCSLTTGLIMCDAPVVLNPPGRAPLGLGPMSFWHPPIHCFSKFLAPFSSTTGYSRPILYLLWPCSRIGYFSKEPCLLSVKNGIQIC